MRHNLGAAADVELPEFEIGRQAIEGVEVDDEGRNVFTDEEQFAVAADVGNKLCRNVNRIDDSTVRLPNFVLRRAWIIDCKVDNAVHDRQQLRGVGVRDSKQQLGLVAVVDPNPDRFGHGIVDGVVYSAVRRNDFVGRPGADIDIRHFRGRGSVALPDTVIEDKRQITTDRSHLGRVGDAVNDREVTGRVDAVKLVGAVVIGVVKEEEIVIDRDKRVRRGCAAAGCTGDSIGVHAVRVPQLVSTDGEIQLVVEDCHIGGVANQIRRAAGVDFRQSTTICVPQDLIAADRCLLSEIQHVTDGHEALRRFGHGGDGFERGCCTRIVNPQEIRARFVATQVDDTGAFYQQAAFAGVQIAEHRHLLGSGDVQAGIGVGT